MLKKLSKQKISRYHHLWHCISCFIVMQILINAGQISSLFEGLMVPLCTYIILAISLNLVVGVLGELSLGHAGFMCVGAFTSAFFSKCMQDTITNSIRAFSDRTSDRYCCSCYFRTTDRYSGIASEW